MANRQVISAHERIAIQAEGEYWWRLADALALDMYTRNPAVLFGTWIRNDIIHKIEPFTANNRTISIQHTAAFNLIRDRALERLHWIVAYNAPGNRLHVMLATQKPLQSNIASTLQSLIHDVTGVDEAIDRLQIWAESGGDRDGWDIGFQNKQFGRPYPWTYVHRIIISPMVGTELNSAALAFPAVMNFLGIQGGSEYNHIVKASSEHMIQQVDDTIDSDEEVDNLMRHMTMIHTARSMYIRGVPAPAGQKQVTANDAPSHSSTRSLLIMRVRELWPEIHAEHRKYLPTTIQRRIQQTLIEQNLRTISGDKAPNPLNQRPEPEQEKAPRQHIVIPESALDLNNLLGGDPIEEI